MLADISTGNARTSSRIPSQALSTSGSNVHETRDLARSMHQTHGTHETKPSA